MAFRTVRKGQSWANENIEGDKSLYTSLLYYRNLFLAYENVSLVKQCQLSHSFAVTCASCIPADDVRFLLSIVFYAIAFLKILSEGKIQIMHALLVPFNDVYLFKLAMPDRIMRSLLLVGILIF